MFGDPLFWLFVLPGLLLGAYAHSRIKLNIAKYSQVSLALAREISASDLTVRATLPKPDPMRS